MIEKGSCYFPQIHFPCSLMMLLAAIEMENWECGSTLRVCVSVFVVSVCVWECLCWRPGYFIDIPGIRILTQNI